GDGGDATNNLTGGAGSNLAAVATGGSSVATGDLATSGDGGDASNTLTGGVVSNLAAIATGGSSVAVGTNAISGDGGDADNTLTGVFGVGGPVIAIGGSSVATAEDDGGDGGSATRTVGPGATSGASGAAPDPAS